MLNDKQTASSSSNNNMMTQDDDDLQGLDIGPIAQSINTSSSHGTLHSFQNQPTNSTLDAEGDVTMTDQSGDEVIKRFEVYLSHKLSDKLYVLQYPMRPKENNYNLNQLKEVRFKPNHKKMEMEFEVNTRSEHFDSDTGQEYSSFSLSSTSVPVKANYAVGILRGNQLHLTPLWNMLQLRPSFQHINEGYSTGKTKVVRKKKTDEGTEGEGDEKAESNTTSQTTGTTNFRLQSDRKALERSYQFMKDQENSEKPVALAFYPPHDSRQHIENLFEQRDEPVKFNVPPTAYLKQLVQYREEDQSSMAQGSLGAIKKIKFGERQVYYALYLAKILPFAKIRELATRIRSDEELTSALQKYGVYVDGRWVLRSEFNEKIIKLKELDKNPWTLLKYPKTAAFREYLLYLFHTEKRVVRRNFVEKTGIEPEKAKQLLEEIAVKVKTDSQDIAAYWVLKYDVDHEFESEFRAFVAVTLKEMWKKRELEMKIMLESKFRDLSILLHETPKPGSRSGSSTNRPIQSVESELRNFLCDILKQWGVCSESYLKKRKNESSSRYIKQAKEEDFQNILDEISVEFNNARILKHKPEYTEQESRLRELVVKAFKDNKYTLTKQIVKDVYKKATGEEIVPSIFAKVMADLASSDATNRWHAKTGTEPLKPPGQ
ncbi:hypothetical protein C9374_005411 [Naegleria lovaniensis]|uniref:Uncharacterized protein n=1 Tax=Naegleria lovaniensis TaxID=51637 RepID=A0AA88GNE2_NAELO|nr:uncharacterized protein C9374_005411 [Naegleria lovaniensis]KAG2382209.1 hypothetical protein C9374_005411 [Naegleria lovaniensis]